MYTRTDVQTYTQSELKLRERICLQKVFSPRALACVYEKVLKVSFSRKCTVSLGGGPPRKGERMAFLWRVSWSPDDVRTIVLGGGEVKDIRLPDSFFTLLSVLMLLSL